jgi:uncharacterized Zn finger protein
MKICKQCGSDEISVAVSREGRTLTTSFECGDCGETSCREEPLSSSNRVDPTVALDFAEAARAERDATELEEDEVLV